MKHFHHLCALVALHGWRFDEVAEAVAAAEPLEGWCSFTAIEVLIRPPGGPLDESDRPLAELLHAIRSADACLARGDAAGALDLLDRPRVWEARESQSLARLAEAHLLVAADSSAARARKLADLATLVDALDRPLVRREHELPPFPGAWDPQRVAGLAARAQAWLDAYGQCP